MPLLNEPENIRANVEELMTNIDSPARKKAIHTLMKKHNITFQEAAFRQARRIAQAVSRKK